VPIDYPQYQIVSFTKGSELKFNARVTVRPEVRVGNYKVLKASRPNIQAVTEEQVDTIVKDLFNRWKNRNPISPGAQVDPTLNVQAPPPSPVSPTDPSQTIKEPNDEFAKAMGADTLVELRTKIKADLEAEAKYNNELDYEENILQEIEKITIVEIPDVLVQDELNRMLVSLQRRVADMGLLMEDYLKGQNKTLEQLKAEWNPQAEKNVRMELGLAEVARLENVSISDQELQEEIDKIQDGRVKQQFEAQEPRMHLRHALRQTRTLNLLKDMVK
jgi:FKBP-type peptidyl-prolyl cis-trans isomerase (trigger factor)